MSRNLTNAGLIGTLPPTIGNLTALSHLYGTYTILFSNISNNSTCCFFNYKFDYSLLAGNKFSGPIPDLSELHELETLYVTLVVSFIVFYLLDFLNFI